MATVAASSVCVVPSKLMAVAAGAVTVMTSPEALTVVALFAVMVTSPAASVPAASCVAKPVTVVALPPLTVIEVSIGYFIGRKISVGDSSDV